ncbi:MAG TPA: tyrosinase family protein, partial [Archangium sp.]|nr:tyrosinase family protein [Archangium sp.]
WHRELLLRYEQELRDVLGDPTYMMPYWDWTAPVDQVFSTADLGDLGGCPATPEGEYGQVSGYIADQGYAASVYDARDPSSGQFSIVCEPKKLTRGSGCLPMAPTLPTAADVARALEIPVYDVSPYDNLHTDEQQSFRQYLEGFTNEDINEPVPFCQFAGCRMHGQVHVWIAGLMGSGAAPNDPLFFLHHANVDRIWAEWQDKYGDSTYPRAAPNDYSGDLYSFTDASGKPVQASSLFDHRARGYKYDTQR